MQNNYIEDQSFTRIDRLSKGEYENCSFNNCNFAEMDLSEYIFTNCSFNNTNLSMAKLNKTAFRDVKFKDCKMLGLRIENCNEFGLSFSFNACQLNHSSFFKSKIKKTLFKNSDLLETDFTEADLTAAIFENCDLNKTIFDQTILEKADFRTSFNYSIDPESNLIKKAKFSISGILGLLDKYDIEVES